LLEARPGAAGAVVPAAGPLRARRVPLLLDDLAAGEPRRAGIPALHDGLPRLHEQRTVDGLPAAPGRGHRAEPRPAATGRDRDRRPAAAALPHRTGLPTGGRRPDHRGADDPAGAGPPGRAAERPGPGAAAVERARTGPAVRAEPRP